MPTLHLIDADSTQACPAVLSCVRSQLNSANGEHDRLVLLGAEPLCDAARTACVDFNRTHAIRTPFGRARLGAFAFKRWWNKHDGFGKVHCWSPGALDLASRVVGHTPKRLSVFHTPDDRKCRSIQRAVRRSRGGVKILTRDALLSKTLTAAGIDSEPSPWTYAEKPTNTTADQPGALTVVLLSDHPRLADTLNAATVVTLACATLADSSGTARQVNLLTHPQQLNRKRAETFFASQAHALHVKQDARVGEPWLHSQLSHVALAVGPDAGGLSLRHALRSGLPVVASRTGPAGVLDDPPSNLHLAPSDATRDMAHALHGVLGDVQSSM